MRNALLAPSSPFIVGLTYAEIPTRQERLRVEWNLKVRNVEWWLAQQFRARGLHGTSFHNRYHLLSCAATEVLEHVGPERVAELAFVIADAVDRMWSAIEQTREFSAGSPLTTQRAAA